jgi:oligopeptide transport system ATP-binding protein
MSTEPLLQVEGLRTIFHSGKQVVTAVNGISFSLDPGETLGIVGESGSGKSVTMLSILRLIPSPPGQIVGGQVWFGGRDLLQLDGNDIRHVRGKEIAMIFQDPMTSLNPVLTIGRHLVEPLQLHMGLDREAARQRSVELLELVGIPDAANRLSDYPHQFSGGMRQRVMIALGLACHPKLLIADEPTTALDVTVQAQIIDLVKRLRDEIGMSVIWITHDLGIVAGLVDRVIVMYAGNIVECASIDELYANPRHPYTLGLLGAIPRLDRAGSKRLMPIPGRPPDLANPPPGCSFAPRCMYRIERCLMETPLLEEIDHNHHRACFVEVNRQEDLIMQHEKVGK